MYYIRSLERKHDLLYIYWVLCNCVAYGWHHPRPARSRRHPEQLRDWFEHRFGPEHRLGTARGQSRRRMVQRNPGVHRARPTARQTNTSSAFRPRAAECSREYDFGRPDAHPGTVAPARHGNTVADLLRARPRMDRFEIHGDATHRGPHAVGHVVRDARLAAWRRAGCATAAQDSFLETLLAVQRVPIDEAPWLRRPTGVGCPPNLPGGRSTSGGGPTTTSPTSWPTPSPGWSAISRPTTSAR